MTIETESIKTPTISVYTATTGLGLKTEEFAEMIALYKIHRVKNSKGKWAISIADFNNLKQVVKDRQKNGRKDRFNSGIQLENKAAITRARKEISDNVRVNVRDRKDFPEKAIIFAGPTNSGKTYHGLEELFHDFEANPEEIHVYCGPLRLLAFEVYNKMVARYGAEKVGFITGEEAINPEAKLLATTAEMAPDEGGSILIDEAHWLADPSRGHIWSRILVSAKYKNFYILTAAEAIDTVKTLTEDAYYTETRTFERKTPIVFKGAMSITTAPARTAIVCFSRKSVYAIAQHLENAGRKVGVLYGGLPLNARKRQIEAYMEGKYDIMVTTDVIGHGINLPIDNVVFAQTEKFDGVEVRELYIWEAAQIAGRAGRYGLSKEGGVYMASGLPWFSKERSIVKEGTTAAGGLTQTDLSVETALLAPRLGDLGLNPEGGTAESSKIIPALYEWQKQADSTLVDRILSPSDLATLINNLTFAIHSVGGHTTPWSSNANRLYSRDELKGAHDINLLELWQLASGPYDPNLKTLAYVANWLADTNRDNSSKLKAFYEDRVSRWVKAAERLSPKEASNQIEAFEEAIRVNAELKMSMVMFGVERNGDLYLGTLAKKDLLLAEEVINNSIIKILSMGIKNSSIGKCVRCGEPTAPWYKECDDCHSEAKVLRYA
jgi:ATP-dependent RNA helicase SUPV3L1/SUV3